MKKHILGLALLAVFAFSAVLSASASAETTLLAEWLLNGAPIETLTSVETTGELLLTTLVLGVETIAILCSGIFDGSVGANGEAEVTELLNLAKELIGSELVGLALVCKVEHNFGEECGAAGTNAEVWADELPWHGNLELMESGSFLVHALNGGYHVICVGGKKAENLCKGLTSNLAANVTGGVSDVFDSTSESVPCTIGEGMLATTEAGLTAALTGTLTVSSE